MEARRGSDALVSLRGREKEEEELDAQGKGAGGDRKEYNPEERDAKQVTLASFQDSAAGWNTYICQSSREGNASPTFTGASSRSDVFVRSGLPFCPARIFVFRTNFPASSKARERSRQVKNVNKFLLASEKLVGGGRFKSRNFTSQRA